MVWSLKFCISEVIFDREEAESMNSGAWSQREIMLETGNRKQMEEVTSGSIYLWFSRGHNALVR